MHSPLGKN
jgi:hypothetical protein